jgi:hypothetical protein
MSSDAKKPPWFTYLIYYEFAEIVNFDIRKKWFVKYICTCNLEMAFFNNCIKCARGAVGV